MNGPTDRKRTAILIFARSVRMDLARRGWPRSMIGLFRLPLLGQRFEDADLHLFTSPDEAAALPGGSEPLTCHIQQAGTFSRSLASAVEELSAEGYSRIVIVGRDCPDLDAEDVRRAVRALSRSRLVLGPDHKGGVYLIGLHACDRGLLTKVRWRRNTDCRQLLELFGPEHALLLSVKQDLDDLNDLRLLAASAGLLSGHARQALRLLAPALPRSIVPPPNTCDRQRTDWQIPPPVQ